MSFRFLYLSSFVHSFQYIASHRIISYRIAYRLAVFSLIAISTHTHTPALYPVEKKIWHFSIHSNILNNKNISLDIGRHRTTQRKKMCRDELKKKKRGMGWGQRKNKHKNNKINIKIKQNNHVFNKPWFSHSRISRLSYEVTMSLIFLLFSRSLSFFPRFFFHSLCFASHCSGLLSPFKQFGKWKWKACGTRGRFLNNNNNNNNKWQSFRYIV